MAAGVSLCASAHNAHNQIYNKCAKQLKANICFIGDTVPVIRKLIIARGFDNSSIVTAKGNRGIYTGWIGP